MKRMERKWREESCGLECQGDTSHFFFLSVPAPIQGVGGAKILGKGAACGTLSQIPSSVLQKGDTGGPSLDQSGPPDLTRYFEGILCWVILFCRHLFFILLWGCLFVVGRKSCNFFG